MNDFTVAICTRNRAPLLERALEALAVSLADDDVPVLVVDNASTDETPGVVERAGARLSVRYIREAEIGLSVARNRAWRECTTEYIVYVDDDAEPPPGWPAAVRAGIARWNPDYFGGPWVPYYITPKPAWFPDSAVSGDLDRPEGMLGPREFVTGMNMGWRVSLLRKLGGFRAELGMRGDRALLGEETELQVRAARESAGVRAVFLPAMALRHYAGPHRFSVRYWWKRSWTYGWQLSDINGGDALLAQSSLALLAETKLGLPLALRLVLRDRGRYPHWRTYALAYGDRACIAFGVVARRASAAPRAIARRLSLGRIAYRIWHAPLGQLRRVAEAGGPREARRTEQGRREMERAAWTLPPVDAGDAPRREVHFLTGRAHWYQSLFCAYSLQRVSAETIAPVFYDDGTLEPQQADALRRVLPLARIVGREEVDARLDAHLPSAKFPTLRRHRLAYPHLKKLTDVHAGSAGWKLVLDSDMLFFREPAVLLAWLAAPAQPCHMVDVEQSYGYSDALMTALAGSSLPSKLNVGVCGLESDAIDWERLEYWCTALLDREGTHYYLEQALTAMLLASRACTVLPPSEYVVLPSLDEGKRPTAVLHHYVAGSKRAYFQHGWRHILGAAPHVAHA